MDNRVSWNIQPERNNPTVVLLVRGIQAFTARTHEVLEVGNVLVGHVVIVEYGWCSWEWLVMDGNDGSYCPMGTPYIVPVWNTLSPSSHVQTSPTRSISHPMTAPSRVYSIASDR